MAILSPPPSPTATTTCPQRIFHFPKFNNAKDSSSSTTSYLNSVAFPINPHRPFLPPPRFNSVPRRRHLCRAVFSPQPPSPKPDHTPPDKDTNSLTGVAAIISRFQDRVQIFIAVLFWMSLFFWASARDGGNNGGSRPNMWSRFRR